MSRPVILVVDHDQRSINLISQVVNTEQIEVFCVRNAEKATAQLNTFSPKAVFLSCHVKGAYPTFSKILQTWSGERFPLVVLHEENVPRDRLAAFCRGLETSLHLAKPIRMSDLATIVDTILEDPSAGYLANDKSDRGISSPGSTAPGIQRTEIHELKRKLTLALEALDEAEVRNKELLETVRHAQTGEGEGGKASSEELAKLQAELKQAHRESETHVARIRDLEEEAASLSEKLKDAKGADRVQQSDLESTLRARIEELENAARTQASSSSTGEPRVSSEIAELEATLQARDASVASLLQQVSAMEEIQSEIRNDLFAAHKQEQR